MMNTKKTVSGSAKHDQIIAIAFTKEPQLYRANRIFIEIIRPNKAQAREGRKDIGRKKAKRSDRENYAAASNPRHSSQ
jgi:hypothetical protein